MSLAKILYLVWIIGFHAAIASDYPSSGSAEGYESVSLSTNDKNFCNRTVTMPFKTPCVHCPLGGFVSVTCPPGTRQVSKQPVQCYWEVGTGPAATIRYSGCQVACETSQDIVECCYGYWGVDCQECPGDASTPCNNRGICSMGMDGNGTCQCELMYDGSACEQCATGRYGINCEAECLCVHGYCNDGIHGDGSCDCHSGYRGQYCEEDIPTCASIECPKFARCVDRNDGRDPGCVCDHGYKPSGYACIAIDPCVDGTEECDTNAICIQNGPGLYECQCKFGYHGDGFLCQPVDPCQINNGGCPVQSTQCSYEGPGLHQCSCLPGYENYDSELGCSIIDLCAQNSSLCHQHANCTTIAPGQMECICDLGYIGDGQECYGNILERLQDIHGSDPDLGGKFDFPLRLMLKVYEDALTRNGPFTVFVSVDEGFPRYITQSARAIIDVNFGRALLRQSILPIQLSAEEMTNTSTLYTLEGSKARFFYRNGDLTYKLEGSKTRRARVLKKDLLAVNGMIHIVDTFLVSPMEIPSSNTRSIANMLITHSNFSQTEALIQTMGMADILDDAGPWTVFAPNNQAWDRLPEGATDYLMSEVGREKLAIILKSHIVQAPLITATDLVNTHRFISVAGTASTVSVTLQGQIQLNGKVNITQADIIARNGMIHHVDGVVIPAELGDLLPHRCDITSSRLVKGACGHCQSELHCQNKDDKPLENMKVRCRYRVNAGPAHGGYTPLIGCSKTCNRTYVVPKCCDNFYGSQCLPCSGGFQNPCFGRGQCNDGYGKDGSCRCESTYYGASCEYCRNTKMYGPYCNQTCSCVRGLCDNRVIESTGRCRPDACDRGYRGQNCDVQAKKCSKSLHCHMHAECVSSPLTLNLPQRHRWTRRFNIRHLRKLRKRTASCKCLPGYSGPGHQCQAIDPCQAPDRGGCHIQAKCTKSGPGKNTCTCDSGYVGDGTYCYPSAQCSGAQHCHQHADCTLQADSSRACVCQSGYHGNGTYCLAENMCLDNNGGCDHRSTCVAVGPGEVNCSCPPTLGGGGFTCYGTLDYEIQNYPQLSRLGQLLNTVPAGDSLLKDLSVTYTVLAPNNSALEQFLELAPERFFQDQGNVLLLLRYHVLPTSVPLSKLRDTYSGEMVYPLADESNFSLNITVIEQDVYINDAKVLEPNLPALNGIIHVIDKVLEPYPISMDPGTLEQVMAQRPELSISYTYLKVFELIDVIENMDSYTIFLPTNRAWEEFDNVSRRLLLYAVTPREILSWQVPKEGLSECSLLSDSPNHKLTVTVDSSKQMFVNGVGVEEGNLVTAGGVIHGIASVLTTDLTRCDVFMHHSKLGDCGPCDGDLSCPLGFTQVEPVLVQENCTYRARSLTVSDQPGCQLLCQRTIQGRECCPGYYGPGCEECPVGAEYPCGNRGNCSDGISGNGFCSCEDGYAGSTCEICVLPSCIVGGCPDGNGGCHQHASCSVTDQDRVVCSCVNGYHGDGYSCHLPTCYLDNGGCDPLANCSVDASDEVVCTCPGNFTQGPGNYCGEQVSCEVDNGGCSPNATCQVFSPNGVLSKSIICYCKSGFVGNGTMCNGDIWMALQSLNQTSYLAMALENFTLDDGLNLPAVLSDNSKDFTVFVPAEIPQEIRERYKNALLKYIVASGIELDVVSMNMTRYETLDGSQIEISSRQVDGEIRFYMNGVLVVEENIPAMNGFIQILESALPSNEPWAAAQASNAIHNFGFIIGAIIASIAVLLLVIFAVWKSRHKARVVASRIRSSAVFGGISSENFDFIRFRPARVRPDLTCTRLPETQGAVSSETLDAPVDHSLKFFSNPVFSESGANDNDSLIVE